MCRELPEEKIYLLCYRDLICGASYIVNVIPIMACQAESFEEAAKKLEA